ncbi:MAG TPA: hypothetical protein VK457_00185 [Chloroflexota bacterium]|nr:hypothetical protein [Chloroflexota bacterium]
MGPSGAITAPLVWFLLACWIRRKESVNHQETKMVDEKRGPQPGTPQARHGGEAVKQKYGAKFYSQIGKKGGEAVKLEKGPEFYAQIGKKGGEATKRSHGSKFYAEIGRKGGEKGGAKGSRRRSA